MIAKPVNPYKVSEGKIQKNHDSILVNFSKEVICIDVLPFELIVKHYNQLGNKKYAKNQFSQDGVRSFLALFSSITTSCLFVE